MPPETKLRNTLRETGRRLTDQRQLLLDVLQEQGGHLDAQELHRLAHERDPHLNLSTVYRTLGLLRDLGLVDEQHLGEEHHHYELKTPSTHYHLVCSVCGAVVEFTSPLIEELKTAVAREHGYAIANVQMDLVGTCAVCRDVSASDPDHPQNQKLSPKDRVIDILRQYRGTADGEQRAAPSREEPHKKPTTLRALLAGTSGNVAALTGGHDLVARLAALGLTPGVLVEVAQNPGHGPVIVLVRGTRLALGRREAAQVLVVPVEAHDGGQVTRTR